MDQPAEPNSAALYNTRKRQGSVGGSQVLDSIVSASNCGFASILAQKSLLSDSFLLQSTEMKSIVYEKGS